MAKGKVAKKEPKKKEAPKKEAPVKAKAVKAPKLEAVEAEAPKKVPKQTAAQVRAAAALSEEESQLLKKWQKLNKQYAEDTPQAYLITGNYDIKSLITHKTHGWGIVLNRRENYIDVLFEVGMKTLIMNFKA